MRLSLPTKQTLYILSLIKRERKGERAHKHSLSQNERNVYIQSSSNQKMCLVTKYQVREILCVCVYKHVCVCVGGGGLDSSSLLYSPHLPHRPL